MRVPRSRARCRECPQHCFCGRSKHIEQNHIGGHQHVPWLFQPFCQGDHAEFHVLCRRAGVDFRPQANKSLSLIQALKAILVGMWMVVNALEKHLKSQSKKGETNAKRA